MNRNLSCLAIFALLTAAVGICIKQTIEFRELLENSSLAILLAAEAAVAGALIATGISLVRRKFARQKKPVSRGPVAAAVRV